MVKEKIYFIENSIDFNCKYLNFNSIRGAEKVLINLTNEISKEDYDVTVFNNTTEEITINNLKWTNIKNYYKFSDPNYLISWSDANLLNLFQCKKKFIWSHSVQTIEKFIRKKQLFSYYSNRPVLITVGEYHYNNRTFLTSPFGKKIIPLAVDDDFLNIDINLTDIPSPIAIFTTRPDRNLDMLLSMWKNIYKSNNKSCLYINPPYELSDNQLNMNIKLRNASNKINLIKDLLNSRVMLIPGHKGEVFCLAAEEAREMCIPIVTMGYGSLYERVEHNKTGFIAKNSNQFVKYATSILNDDSVYLELKKNLIKKKRSRKWSDVANDFIKILNN